MNISCFCKVKFAYFKFNDLYLWRFRTYLKFLKWEILTKEIVRRFILKK